MNVFLLDGTYELFRHFYAVPSLTSTDGQEVGAVRGVVGSLLSMFEESVTHLGVATDHVVESFRNGLWDGYKTGEGIAPVLFRQSHPLEEALKALGVSCGRWSTSRPTTRSQRPPRAPLRTTAWSRCSSAPLTRTWHNACGIAASCSSTAAQVCCATRMGCGGGLASTPGR